MELLDGKTRIVYEAYDGAGNLYTYTRNLDELADLPGGRGLADGAMDQWGNGRTPRDMVMQGNAPGNMADDLHMYGMADGTGGRPQYDLYANNRPGGAATGGAKTGDTLNDATQQAARRADDAADAGRAAGGSGSAGAPKGSNGGGIPKDNGNRIKEIEVEFNNKSHLDESEFTRQLSDQQKGMNELTVEEYLENRQQYLAQGRAAEGNAMQQAARENAYLDKVAELRSNGLSLEEAREQADKWINTQAALHNPDQVAGGKFDNIGEIMVQYEMYFTNEYIEEIVYDLAGEMELEVVEKDIETAMQERDKYSESNLYTLRKENNLICIDCNDNDWIYPLVVQCHEAKADAVKKIMLKWDNLIREEYGQELTIDIQNVYGKDFTLLRNIEKYYNTRI